MTVNIVVSIVFCISMVILGIYVAITKDFTLISYINQTTIADKHKNQIAYIFALCIRRYFLATELYNLIYWLFCDLFCWLTLANFFTC
ncbi:TPA: hypothetical protein OVP91_000474 [Staphylococcus aureus]|nr:hypothetical protein [Staphylococcus aureus]HCV3818561.1 hypothetical protein [Staphylococcus aureus]